MKLHQALEALLAGQTLPRALMLDVMREIMGGEATPAQVAGFLIALRMKGEAPEEIAAAAQVMREKSRPLQVEPALRERLVDTCGTGGDGAGLFNVSTASALLLAALGVPVAKHGNRSVSSSSGSADVLAAAGIALDLEPEQSLAQLRAHNFTFLFAPQYHPAMKHAIGPRRELATRTVFNLLGPLTNPAGAQRQVLGLFSAQWLEPVARVLAELGSVHVLTVHGEDGLDEISLSAPTQICELREGERRSYRIEPGQFGLPLAEPAALKVESPAQSLALIRAAFAGQAGPVADAIALNAGAGLYVGGVADSLARGVEEARTALAEARAEGIIEDLSQQRGESER